MSNPIRIIILEDKAVDAHLIESVLKRSDLSCETRIANSRDVFVDLLTSFLPDIILSDHRLPKFSSHEALKLAREKFPFIPFILVTGTISDEFATGIIKAGGDDYILKENLKRLPTSISQAIEKKKTEGSLFRSEANLRSIFENTDTAFVLLDLDFKVISFNHLASDWMKSAIALTLTLGESISRYSKDGNSPRMQLLKEKVMAGNFVEYETHLDSDHGKLWYYVRFLPVRNDQGLVTGASLAISDITHRKHLESERRKTDRELLKAHSKLLFHIENAPLGFIEWDSVDHVKSWSKRAEEIFGWTEREVMANQNAGFVNVYVEDLPMVTQLSHQLWSGAILKNNIQYRNITKDGRIIWCEWFHSVQRDSTGNVVTILSLVQDISDQKELELQREFDTNNLEALINNTDDLMWSVDLDMKLITSNGAFDRLVGLMSGRPIARGSDVLAVGFGSEQLERYRQYYLRAFSGESFTEIEHTTSPIEIWSEISFYPIRRADEVVGTACFSRDISARIKAEKELAVREQRFRTLIENSYDAIILQDKDFNIVYQSPSVTRILGFTQEERQGKKVMDYIHPEDLNDITELFKNVEKNKGRAFPFLYRSSHRSGHYVWIEGVIKNLLDDPSVNAYVANYRDVTVRKTAQENLELTIKRFEQAQRIAHLGHWTVDFVNFQSFWSDEAFRIYGIRPGSVAPSEELFLKYVHPDDLERVRLIIREGTLSFKPFSFFHRIVQDGGEERNLLSVGQFEFDKFNKATGLYGISLDITELTEKEKELELANRELETFIYKIYHDLRAPIASIQGMVNIGKIEKDGLKSAEYFGHIGQVADKQSKMLQNLAACMTIRSRELMIQEFDLDDLMKEIFEELRTLPSFERITFKIDNRLGAIITSDKELLGNILMRLIENAVLFQNQGRPDPKVSVAFKSTHHDSAMIVVEDNGVGMPAEVKDKIFDMFYRGSEVSKGSGLGLYFVKNAVQKLRGILELSTTEGEGSHFRIILPTLQVSNSKG